MDKAVCICGATGEPCICKNGEYADCAECPIGAEFRRRWEHQPVLHDDPDEFDERIR